MTRWISEILEKYGQEVSLEPKGVPLEPDENSPEPDGNTPEPAEDFQKPEGDSSEPEDDSQEPEEEPETFRAFLQPLTQRDEMTAEPFEAGWLDRRLWLYLGRRELNAGDVLLWKERRFRVRSVQPHCIGGQLCHWRAVLERAREAE